MVSNEALLAVSAAHRSTPASGTLEAVARARPKTPAALHEIRKWQVELLGADFLKALGN